MHEFTVPSKASDEVSLAPHLLPQQALLGSVSMVDEIAGTDTPQVHVDGGQLREAGADVVEIRQGLRVAGLRLMIRYQHGSELTEVPAVYALPNAPGWFLGISNLHGALVPVVDLSQYLQLGESNESRRNTARQMLLILGSGAAAVGVLINGLPQRMRFTASDRTQDAPVPDRLNECIDGTYWIEGQSWMDLNPVELAARMERQLIR